MNDISRFNEEFPSLIGDSVIKKIFNINDHPEISTQVSNTYTLHMQQLREILTDVQENM